MNIGRIYAVTDSQYSGRVGFLRGREANIPEVDQIRIRDGSVADKPGYLSSERPRVVEHQRARSATAVCKQEIGHARACELDRRATVDCVQSAGYLGRRRCRCTVSK